VTTTSRVDLKVANLMGTLPAPLSSVTDLQAGVAVLVALGSAAGFAFSNALQHRVAGTVPLHIRRPLRVLAHLVRRRLWLVATAVSFTALVLHAVALRLGSIALVQPLMLVGVVLAVPLRAALEHQRPSRDEVRAVGVTSLGLGGFLICANPAPSGEPPDLRVAVGMVAAGVAGTPVALRLLTSPVAARGPRAHACLLGAAAGIMFGLTAGLLKLLGPAASSGPAPLGLLVTGLICAGVLGTALNQRAYQIAPLSFSMPLVNVVDIVVALLFGALVFHEAPGQLPALVMVQVVALGFVAVGLRLIARLASESACLEAARREPATAGAVR